MNVSKFVYAKAKVILRYIKKHPDCYAPDVAIACNISHATTRAVVFEMVRAGVITYEERIIGKGKRHYYRATGADLPPRSTTFDRSEVWDNSYLLNPVDVDTYRQMPRILRALTPVILPAIRRSVKFTGPSVQQHILQSAINRLDRSKALSGAVSTGVSLL